MVDLISLSIPIFFLLIAIELIVARVRGARLYRLNDTINDLSCGVLSELRKLIFSVGLYTLVFEFSGEILALPRLSPGSLWTGVIAFVGIDFLYYWFHRLSHERNFLWAAHVVHHQSEEYNFSVALRQSAIQGLFSAFFYLPLALVGVPPLVFLLHVQINTIYQFWVHTRLVATLGPLEWVMNTPSHHRVHHGCDPKYADRNYAGVFIIWDRLFGTFQLEEEEPTYGTSKPLHSWNPLWANLDVWVQIARVARGFERPWDRFTIWFRRPGWTPSEPLPELPEVRDRPHFDATPGRLMQAYLLAQFVCFLLVSVGMLFAGGGLDAPLRLLVIGWLLATSIAIGAGFESRPWFWYFDALRLAAAPLIALGLSMLLPTPEALSATPWLIPGAVSGFALASLAGLAGLYRRDPSGPTSLDDPSAGEPAAA